MLPVLPMLRAATATLLGVSALSLSSRVLFMRWLRRTRDGELSHWCRRINVATAVAGKLTAARSHSVPTY